MIQRTQHSEYRDVLKDVDLVRILRERFRDEMQSNFGVRIEDINDIGVDLSKDRLGASSITYKIDVKN